MKRKRVVGLFFIITLASAVVAFRSDERYFEIAKSLDIFATLFKEVNAYYVDDVDPQKLIRRSIDSMLES
jgi:carboxyl-terminal processing protease